MKTILIKILATLFCSVISIAYVNGQEVNITAGPPSDIKAKVNTTVSTECVVVGDQSNIDVLTFSKDNNAIAINSEVGEPDQYQITGKYTLHVLNADNADSGMYSCSMHDQGYEWELVVYDEAKSMSLTWENGSVVAPLDTVANLTCSSGISMPPATFRWFENNVEITNSSVYLTPDVNSEGYGMAESVLELNTTNQIEGTVYKCTVDVGGIQNILSQSLTVTFSVSSATEVTSCIVLLLSVAVSRLV